MSLRPELIVRALVDDLAIIQRELLQVNDPCAGDGGNMKVLDTMQVSQRKGKLLSFFGCDERIDLTRVNWLLTFPLATTVAMGLPASGEAGKEDFSHHCHPSRTTDASRSVHFSGTNAATIPRRCLALHGHWRPSVGKELTDRDRPPECRAPGGP